MIPTYLETMFKNEISDGDVIRLPTLGLVFRFQSFVDHSISTSLPVVVVEGAGNPFVLSGDSPGDAFFSAFLQAIDVIKDDKWATVVEVFQRYPQLRSSLDQHLTSKARQAAHKRMVAQQREGEAIRYEMAGKALLVKICGEVSQDESE